MIENSLDAGADRITIQVQVPKNSTSTETSAGLFSVQVTDNGTGINKQDLTLLCERHATSKLESVGDLREVGTFGFRGEALASCSQVGRVEVSTRSRETGEEVAWRAEYVGGKLLGDPTPLAGNYGTCINVKDLFYANRVRREALMNSSEEYQKIVQVIQSYALNQAGKCSFALTRKRDTIELQTTLAEGPVSVVKNLWNEELGGSLLPFDIEMESELGIESGGGGWASRTTFHKLKSPQVILFLNGRLIEHATLRRALLQAFAPHLPTSPPAHPFIYLSLMLKGTRVDVNVHPSKKQVYFLDEAEIISRVVKAVTEQVLKQQYETQSLKPVVISSGNGKRSLTEKETGGVKKISGLYPSQRVLTDSGNHKIDAFLYHSSQSTSNTNNNTSNAMNNAINWSPLGLSRLKVNEARKRKLDNELASMSEGDSFSKYSLSSPLISSSPKLDIKRDEEENISVKRNEMDSDSGVKTDETVEYSSVKSDKMDENSVSQNDSACKTNMAVNVIASTIPRPTELLSKSNAQLSQLLKPSLLVGLIDSKWCLLQSTTNLLLCDMDRLNYELYFSILTGLPEELTMTGVFEMDMRVWEVFGDAEVGREAEGVLMGQVDWL